MNKQSRLPAPRTRGSSPSIDTNSPDAQLAAGGPSERPLLSSLLRLRDDTAMPIYQQLEEQLEALIADGSLPVGTVLPAERQLAESLGLSRATVQRAYSTLRQRKLLLAQGRR